MSLSTAGSTVGLIILALCMMAIAYRMITANTDADRAVAADLLMFCFTGMIALLGIILAGAFFFDLILVASVVGFLSAVSLSRVLTRGKR